MPQQTDAQTFWEHLDELRHTLLRIILVTVTAAIAAFLFKEQLFDIVLAPKDADFITYRLMGRLSAMEHFSVSLVNTGLAEQFVIHMQTALAAGVLCASPYILYEIFRFVSPALYTGERRHALRLVGSGYTMFLLGVLLSYYLIFPLTFRFLGTYQVSGEVENMITLKSYMSTLIMMCLTIGIVFEMPVLAWLFSRMGLLTAPFMRRYRRHAVVLILIVAAVITPTSDVFTLLLVSLPMCLLYEASIVIVSMAGKNHTKA